MNITIRKISVEDAPAVSSLSQQLGYQLSPSETAGQIKEVMASSDNCAFVALSDEKIIGWIHGFKAVRMETKSFVEIGCLVVDENYRGKGMGKKLIDRIKHWCVEQDVRSLRVRCNTKRAEAHQFYLTLGFSEMKEQKIFGIEV
jgi:N-acetylglutamate synthase-like GNAT family acetyltransferase